MASVDSEAPRLVCSLACVAVGVAGCGLSSTRAAGLIGSDISGEAFVPVAVCAGGVASFDWDRAVVFDIVAECSRLGGVEMTGVAAKEAAGMVLDTGATGWGAATDEATVEVLPGLEIGGADGSAMGRLPGVGAGLGEGFAVG